jgi:hypothetical protein
MSRFSTLGSLRYLGKYGGSARSILLLLLALLLPHRTASPRAPGLVKGDDGLWYCEKHKTLVEPDWDDRWICDVDAEEFPPPHEP